MADITKLVLAVDSSQVKRATRDVDGLQGAGNRSEKSFNGAALALKAFAAALAIGATFRSVIRATVEQERVTAQLEQTLRSTGRYTPELSKGLQDYAKALQAVTTYGDEAIIGSQALLLTFTQIGGEAFPRAQKAILDVATAMRMDLQSATLQVGKALNDPILGLTALQRSGIQFSESQKEVIKDMVATGRVAEAQNEILKELERQFGGSAEAARNTLGGALAGLKNAFGDLLEGDSGKDGVRGATAAINDLTALMSDPRTIENAQKLANALIAGFGKVIEYLSTTVEFTEWLGTTLGLFAVPLGNIGLVEQEIESVTQKIERLEAVQAKQKASRWSFEIFGSDVAGDLKEARAELARLTAARDAWFARRAEPPGAVALPDVPALVNPVDTGAKDREAAEREAERLARAELQAWEAMQKRVQGMQIEADTWGVNSTAATLYRMSLEGATNEQLASAQAALQTVEAYEAEAEAERKRTRAGEQATAVLRELSAEGSAEIKALEARYQQRQEIFGEALALEYFTKLEHEQAMTELERSYSEERREILEAEAKQREQTALSTMAAITTITGAQIAQMSGLFEEASGVGKAFFVLSQGLAAANAIIGGLQAAMAIRVAYAQMAAMAGPAAPTILKAGEIHAKVSEAMGFATAGMIASQTVASFEGGGFTGFGPRVGGLDGKGGRMAMVHPNETIIDHTKGGAMSISVPVNVHQNKLLAADLKRSIETTVIDTLRRHT